MNFSFVDEKTSIPGSLFQLLELFTKRLKTEISIEINKGLDGALNVFLTEGHYDSTDSLRESQSKCGIKIHTHPFYQKEGDIFRNNENISPPSPADIKNSIIKAWASRFTGENDSRDLFPGIPQKQHYVRDYMYDGKLLWSYRANSNLIQILLKLSYDEKRWILEKLEKIYTKNVNDFYVNEITIQDFIDIMNEDGVELEATNQLKNKSVIIEDSLICDNERRDRHLVFPSSQLLNSQDLEDLYKRAINIIKNRNDKRSKESPLGGGKIKMKKGKSPKIKRKLKKSPAMFETKHRIKRKV